MKSPEGDPMVDQGPIFMQRLMDGNSTGGFTVSMVTFNPGSKLAFHTHPYEQILFVTAGKGILATRDKEYAVTPGMVIVIPAGEVHTHGAAEDTPFSHLAVYKGDSTVVK